MKKTVKQIAKEVTEQVESKLMAKAKRMLSGDELVGMESEHG